MTRYTFSVGAAPIRAITVECGNETDAQTMARERLDDLARKMPDRWVLPVQWDLTLKDVTTRTRN